MKCGTANAFDLSSQEEDGPGSSQVVCSTQWVSVSHKTKQGKEVRKRREAPCSYHKSHIWPEDPLSSLDSCLVIEWRHHLCFIQGFFMHAGGARSQMSEIPLPRNKSCLSFLSWQPSLHAVEYVYIYFTSWKQKIMSLEAGKFAQWLDPLLNLEAFWI